MKARYIVGLLTLALVLCACTANTPASPTPAPDVKAEDVIICKVNDATIMRSDFVPVFEVYAQYYSTYVDLTNEQALKELQDSVFDQLVRMEIMQQQAIKEGVTLDDADEKDIQAAVEEEYAAIMQQAESMAQSEGAADTKKRAEEILNTELAQDGLTPALFKERSAEQKRKARCMDKLYEQMTAAIVYTEQEAEQAFLEKVEEDRKSFTENPAGYESALSNAQTQGSLPPLFVPEGYVRVKHILVDTEELANEMVALLRAGADFDTLMAEYGTDPGMKAEPNMSLGYLMGEGTNFDAAFKEAGFALVNVGDFSEPVKSSYDYGYHVIKLVEKVASRAYTFQEMKDAFMNAKLGEMKNVHFTELLQAWIDNADITSYIGRIRDVGKAS